MKDKDTAEWTWREVNRMCSTVVYKLELVEKGHVTEGGARGLIVWDKLCSGELDSILEKSIIDASKFEWKITCRGVIDDEDE